MFKQPFLIAEVSINHNGSIFTAKKIIDLAKKYNFDAVKFQKRNPDISVPADQKNVMRESPWGYISYLDYKKKIEFGKKEYNIINQYCKMKKIVWFASPWDIDSVNFLKQFRCKYNKVASAMLTNITLLEAIAAEKKHTFISVGMSKEKDIVKAIKIFKKLRCKFTLMYTVSSYPANEEDLNLRSITYLKKKYKCEVGYSGHERTVSPSIMAYFLGANVIERHITLDRSMYGSDQAASLEPRGLRELVGSIKKIEQAIGQERIGHITEEEILVAKKLRAHINVK